MPVHCEDLEERPSRSGRRWRWLQMLPRTLMPLLLLVSLLEMPVGTHQPALAFTEEARVRAEPEGSRDSAVLETVLKDLLSYPGRESPLQSPRGSLRRIYFSPEAWHHHLRLEKVLRRRDPKQWDKLSPEQLEMMQEAARDLSRRVTAKDGFDRFAPKDKRVVLYRKEQEAEDARHLGPRQRDPSRQVFRAYPPGYSSDQQLALVHLVFPWSVHSGDATYVLIRRDKGWIVQLRQYAIYP